MENSLNFMKIQHPNLNSSGGWTDRMMDGQTDGKTDAHTVGRRVISKNTPDDITHMQSHNHIVNPSNDNFNPLYEGHSVQNAIHLTLS